jgi:HD-like signal output (HDOD) protein
MSARQAAVENRVNKKLVLANIPAFPPVVLRVLDILSTEQPNNRALIREISLDATLSAQLLRVANSPLFGFTSHVETVQQAVALLGSSRVQSLVMAVATTNYMRGGPQTDALQKCWRHSMASAILSRELARASRLPPDSAYSFGLLHDIGRLGLLVAYPTEYKGVLKVADRDKVSLLDQEKLLFGMDHCEAGRLLLENCKLPEEFCQIVGRHHDPPDGRPIDPLLIAYLACQMSDTLGYSVVAPLKATPLRELLNLLPAAARAHFPTDPETLKRIIAKGMGNDDPLGGPPLVQTEMDPPAHPSPTSASSFGVSRQWAAAAGLMAAMALTIVCFVFYWFWTH